MIYLTISPMSTRNSPILPHNQSSYIIVIDVLPFAKLNTNLRKCRNHYRILFPQLVLISHFRLKHCFYFLAISARDLILRLILSHSKSIHDVAIFNDRLCPRFTTDTVLYRIYWLRFSSPFFVPSQLPVHLIM